MLVIQICQRGATECFLYMKGERSILNKGGKKKTSYAEVAKIYSKNESSIHEIMKKEKEICVGFAVAHLTAKVKATVRGMCLVKTEKPLNLHKIG